MILLVVYVTFSLLMSHLFAHRMMQLVARSVRLGRLITEETQLKEQLKREAAALAAETKAREAVVGSLAKSEAEGVAFREEVEERETRQREARVRGLARRLFLGKAVTVRNVPLASDSVRPRLDWKRLDWSFVAVLLLFLVLTHVCLLTPCVSSRSVCTHDPRP